LASSFDKLRMRPRVFNGLYQSKDELTQGIPKVVFA
jgi:hypothetical protein